MWPGINANIVQKHYSKSPKSVKGHMRADQMNVRSTKTKLKPIEKTREMTTNNVRENEYYIKIVDLNDKELTGKLYSD